MKLVRMGTLVAAILVLSWELMIFFINEFIKKVFVIEILGEKAFLVSISKVIQPLLSFLGNPVLRRPYWI